ncbi:MAG TPA: hypothetical protein VMG30_15465 [Acidobacteriota bacterium]|nr:hypothetical protein [Acidobacteriota bacterium]
MCNGRSAGIDHRNGSGYDDRFLNLTYLQREIQTEGFSQQDDDIRIFGFRKSGLFCRDGIAAGFQITTKISAVFSGRNLNRSFGFIICDGHFRARQHCLGTVVDHTDDCAKPFLCKQAGASQH